VIETDKETVKMTNHPQIAISTGLAELAHTEYQVKKQRRIFFFKNMYMTLSL